VSVTVIEQLIGLFAGAGFSLAGARLINASIVPIVSNTYFMVVVLFVQGAGQ
jgi:hypothetical protein